MKESEQNKEPDHHMDGWIKYLEDNDVEEILCYDLESVSDIVDYVILGSARNSRHMSHVCEDAMRWSKEQDFGLVAADGLNSGEWVVLDYGHYMIHLVLPETRYRIDLENFWEKLIAQKRSGEND